MTFDLNRAMYDSSSTSGERRNSDFQKIFNDTAPTMGYLSSKAPCEFILVPPHPMHGVSQNMTSGFFREDELRGVVPTLGQYGFDWAYVYRKIGNDPDPKNRRDILAINMIEGEDGMIIQAEGEWGRGYKSPMYKMREYLWRTGGGHKYNKQARRSLPSIIVDTTTPQYKRALELVPAEGNDLNTPFGRATRTLFLQGYVMRNAGIDYTVNEEGQPSWPRHKILMINQVSAIKSREDARQKEGFYDAFFERTDGLPFSREAIMQEYGDISSDSASLNAWEAGFLHSDFATQQKLVTFSSYATGAAGIATYCCNVGNVADKFGQGYALPDAVLQTAKPFSEYILLNTEKLQTEWLQELFPGDEWALIGSGVLNTGSVQVVVPEMPTPTAMPAAPRMAAAPRMPAAPAMPTAPRMPTAPAMPTAPRMPTAMPTAPRMPTAPAMPTAVPTAPAMPKGNLSDQMKTMMAKLNNIQQQ